MGSLAPEVLYPRRLAARALGMVLAQYELGGMALKLNPDDPTQALPGAGPGEIEFFEDYAGGRGEVVATVVLEQSQARVLVERVERLLRRNHAREVRAEELGIARRPGVPDLDVVVDLQEVIEVEGALMRTARQRPCQPRAFRRPGGARPSVRAFGSSR